MSAVDLDTRFAALSRIAPFDRLDAEERRLIARHARLRTFPPGQVLIAAGGVGETLFVRLEGGAFCDGRAAPDVFDAPGLLFGLAAEADYLAGPEGLTALVIAKPHVFTIVRECPEFVVGLRRVGTTP